MAPFLRPSLLFVAFRRLVDPSATPTATSPVVTSPAVARPVSDFFRISLAGLLMVTLWCVASFAEDPTPPKSIEDTKEQLKKAGQLFKDKKFGESSALVEVCTQAFVPLVLDSEKKNLPEWERIHKQLLKASEALSIEGAEFSPLPEWSEIATMVRNAKMDKGKPTTPPSTPAQPKSDPGAVSFSKDVAPWIVASCGRCHVDKESGGFQMANYEQLMKGSKAGAVLFAGDPDGSQLLSVIETGTMPPNGSKVSPDNLAKLKQWIQQGAKFDGEDPKASLKALAGNGNPTMPANDKPVEVKQSTGKETVSFANDIAPILVANCNGCHYGGNRPSGGFAFNNFTGLLKGGTSGPALAPGKGDDSLLVKKLLGTAGQRMPAGGRPALSPEQIQLVKTWIDEGATYDGDSRESQLDSVIAKSWAAKANHSELMAKRMERAKSRWQQVAPKSTPDEASDDEFHIVGNIGEGGAKQLLAQANNAAKNLKKQLKISPKDPLIKGGVTIYALKSRYDYSELGNMLEKRSLPPEWSGHWRKDVLDLYIAMVYDKSDGKLNETSLLQQLTSVWVASHDGVPKWFADGAGRNAMANAVGQNDARVQPWFRRFPEVLQDLKTIKPLTDGKVYDEDEAVLGV
ncbi:MAG: c-type cytochrome domain-containing protein, partial [Pirellula sp.]